jgi:amphi-Trp domain-containing protein
MPEEFRVERTASRAAVAETVRAVADGVRSGAVALEDGDARLSVEVPPELTSELELELETTEAGESAPGDGTDGDVEGRAEIELEVELTWSAGPGEAVPVPSAADAIGANAASDTRAGAEGTTHTGAGAEGTTHSGTGAEDTMHTGARAEGVPVVRPESNASAARFELYTDRADEWRWRLVHDNGNVIADGGEGYTRKENARNGLESVRANAPGAGVVEVRTEE